VKAGCETPLELPALVDYWFGELAAAEADRVEEHVFECDGCARRLRELVALGDGVRRLAHEGAVSVVVTPSFVDALSRAGLRTREYVVPPGGRVDCTVTAKDDMLISRMRADFTGVSRLDVVVEVEGRPKALIEDVPISPEAGELIVAQSMPAIRALGRTVLHFRLLSREGSGERVLGDYTFHHTPTPQ
jgi:hypothetical protein